MLKRNKGMLIVTSLVLLLPMVVGLLLWSKLPEQVPIHWNTAGEIDGWGSRAMVVFGLPLFMLAIHWACALASCTDPKHKEFSSKVIHLVLWLTPAISLVCHTFVYAAAMGYELAVEIIMPLLLGVLFMAIGNLLPKCKRNYTVGIKLPWTLNDEENWNQTHRFAGKLWVGGGVLIAATAIFGSFWVFIAVTLIMAFVPIVYSYILYRKKQNEE